MNAFTEFVESERFGALLASIDNDLSPLALDGLNELGLSIGGVAHALERVKPKKRRDIMFNWVRSLSIGCDWHTDDATAAVQEWAELCGFPFSL